jgi:ribose transport system permease protein
MSFVWMGLAVMLMPRPGGSVPEWLTGIMKMKPPFVPFPIIAAVVIAIVVHVGLMQSSYGAVMRGVGGNPRAVDRAGWSLLRIRITMYMLAGFFGVLSGLSLIGLTTSADAHIADRYTLLSIAGVILGGGEFVGGRVSPIGAVLGAITLALASSQLLNFLRIPPDWQIGAQGAILIVVLALRALIRLREAR